MNVSDLEHVTCGIVLTGIFARAVCTQGHAGPGRQIWHYLESDPGSLSSSLVSQLLSQLTTRVNMGYSGTSMGPTGKPNHLSTLSTAHHLCSRSYIATDRRSWDLPDPGQGSCAGCGILRACASSKGLAGHQTRMGSGAVTGCSPKELRIRSNWGAVTASDM